MKILSHISRLFRIRSANSAAPAPPAAPDYSLRPNPDTYLDQNGESDTILNRIRSSSSSVVGIAGVRGAGKSSLALKVLGSCDKSGYFTLLIYAPTGYEPREFLLSIFQRVCEAAITRLETLFGQEQTVQARGKAEMRRARLMFACLLLGGVLILGVPIVYSYYYYLNQRTADFRSELRRDIAHLQSMIDDLTDSQLLLDDYSKHPENYKNDKTKPVDDRFAEGGLRELTRRFEFYDYSNDFGARREPSMKETLQSVINDAQPSDLAALSGLFKRRLAILKERLTDSQNYLTSGPSAGDYFLRTTLPLIVGGLILYLGAFAVAQSGWKLRRRIKLQHKYPKETGLYQLAKETLEHLKFQMTVTSSQDTSISLWKLAGKLVRTKQLETRPISLPGLTADCNLFINYVAEVFGGKTVICLDELDKIADSNQLEELLRSVKGILGQNKSHFLLTVSEDALARFSTRRRAERDIVESSFDEIVSISRVNFVAAKSIVTKMLNLDEQQSFGLLDKNVLLVWMFGGAIPREIKRNVVAAQGFDFVNGDPKKLWAILFTALTDSLVSWALVVSAEKDVSYDFLFCLETTRQIGTDSLWSQDAQCWLKNLIDLWSTRYQLPFVCLPTHHHPATTEDAEVLIESFERGVFELAIGAYALLVVSAGKAIESAQTDKLLKVFGLLAYSPSFAGFKFHSLLNDAGVLTASGLSTATKNSLSN